MKHFIFILIFASAAIIVVGTLRRAVVSPAVGTLRRAVVSPVVGTLRRAVVSPVVGTLRRAVVLQSASAETEIDFETQVLPILQNSCFRCHSAPKADADGTITRPKGGVQLDSVKGIEASLHGAVIIPSEPEDSLLYQRITLPEGETGIMPPAEEDAPLAEKQTDLIRKWIEAGADYGNWKGIQQPPYPPSQGGGLVTETQRSGFPITMPPVTSLAFSLDGKSVVASSQAGLHVYDWPTLNLQRRIEVKARNVHHLAFSPSGDRVAVGGGNPATEGTVEIFSWPAGKSLRVLRGHRDSVMAVAWRNASSLASASLDRRVLLWDLRTGKPTQDLKGHSRGVSSLCFLKDDETLVSTGIDRNVRVWNVTTGALIRSLNNHTMPVHALALRPGDIGMPLIASASDDRTVRLWQPTIGRMVKFARLNAATLNVAWLNDGSRIVATCVDGRICIIDPDTVSVIDEIDALDGWIYALTVHPTDGSLVVGGLNGQVKRITPFQR